MRAFKHRFDYVSMSLALSITTESTRKHKSIIESIFLDWSCWIIHSCDLDLCQAYKVKFSIQPLMPAWPGSNISASKYCVSKQQMLVSQLKLIRVTPAWHWDVFMFDLSSRKYSAGIVLAPGGCDMQDLTSYVQWPADNNTQQYTADTTEKYLNSNIFSDSNIFLNSNIFQEQSRVHAHEDPVDWRRTIHPGSVQQTIQQHRGDGELLHHQQTAHQGSGACESEDASVWTTAVTASSSTLSSSPHQLHHDACPPLLCCFNPQHQCSMLSRECRNWWLLNTVMKTQKRTNCNSFVVLTCTWNMPVILVINWRRELNFLDDIIGHCEA